jgi:hypothetical protein
MMAFGSSKPTSSPIAMSRATPRKAVSIMCAPNSRSAARGRAETQRRCR